MDVCIEAGKDKYIHYMDTHEYMVIDEGAYTISALPLMLILLLWLLTSRKRRMYSILATWNELLS